MMEEHVLYQMIGHHLRNMIKETSLSAPVVEVLEGTPKTNLFSYDKVIK